MFQVSTTDTTRKWRHTALFAAIASISAACSSGGGADIASVPAIDGSNGTIASAICDPLDSSTAGECGTLLVGLTDAEGDIISYSVDVTAMTLERAGGETVEILPQTTRIDFAQLTELSELVSAILLPPGIYVGGSVQLNYTDAEVYVEAAGEVVAATVVDSAGAPLEASELRIDFAETGRLAVTRGQTAFMEMDFDLSVSHSVDTAQSPPVVTAEPFISAEISPVDEKELRIRGDLVSVDLGNQSYDLRLLPWHKRIGDHGSVTVNISDATVFHFGNDSFTGDDGLAELNELGAGTITAAFGTLDLSDRAFTADIVLARDSIGGDTFDAIHGNVVSRSGDMLTVKGAFAVRRNDRPRFHRTVVVQVGPNTGVKKVTDANAMITADALSVGQRIVAFGQINTPSDTTDPESEIPVLDARNGRVRMHPTHITGQVSDVIAGQVTMNLRAIDRLGIDHFDFSGTGMTPDLDADPAAYEIATATLPLTSISVDRAARVIGFVTPFGVAPPDFEGRTIIGHDQLRAALGIGWVTPGTTAPFSSMSSTGLTLDLANPDIGTRHHMLIGHELVDLFDLTTAPTVTPAEPRTLFSLHEPGHVESFTDFVDFVDELTRRLNNSDTVRSMAAYGGYDELVNELEAKKVIVLTQPATSP